MSDSDVSRTIPAHVDVADSYDVMLWAFVIGVAPAEIVDAVCMVGAEPRQVYEELRRRESLGFKVAD